MRDHPPLVHWSAQPLKSVEPRGNTLRLRPGKPNGLWVSPVGSYSWKDFCENESFGLERLVYATRVYLRDDANLLWITNGVEFDAFSDEYAFSIFPDEPRPRRDGVNWTLVAERYDGIMIIPYIGSRRLSDDSLWYYGWDCASGCIWNPNAIDRIEPYD